MKKFACCFLLLFITILSSAFSQKENYNWLFATSIEPNPATKEYSTFGFTFNEYNGYPKIFISNDMSTKIATQSSIISDASGNVLFNNYPTSWTSCFGFGLDSNLSPKYCDVIIRHSLSGSLFFKNQYEKNKYYYIYNSDSSFYTHPDSCYHLLALYLSTLVKEPDKKYGEIVSNSKCMWSSSKYGQTWGITGCYHKNNRDIWIVVCGPDSNSFSSFLFGKDGMEAEPVVSYTNESVKYLFPGYWNGGGFIRLSPDGKKIFFNSGSWYIWYYFQNDGYNQIFDFDNSTGKISAKPIFSEQSKRNISVCGSEFSPDGTKLYFSEFYYLNDASEGPVVCNLFQIDMTDNNKKVLIDSGTLNISDYKADTLFYNSMELAPDGRIYISNSGFDYVSVILDPNQSGLACNFTKRAMELGMNCSMVMPTLLHDNNLPLNNIKIWGDSSVCSGNEIRLHGDTLFNAKYVWTGPDNFSSNEISPVILNATESMSGFYKLTVTVNKSDVTDSVHVVIKPKPNAEIVFLGDSIICTGNTVVLGIKDLNPNSVIKWSTCDTTDKILISKAGLYSLIITNEFGCSDTAYRSITQSPKPRVSISALGQTSFCKGDSLVLKAIPDTSGYVYLWSSGETSDSIIVKQSGNFSVIAMNSDGCKDTAEITINVFDIPKARIISSGRNSICAGDSILLSASPSGLGYTYFWNTGDTTQSIMVKQAGIYKIEVWFDNLCSNADSLMIIELPLPEVKISGNDLICPGVPSTLSVQQDFVSYLWNTKETTKQIPITQPGNYSVTVTDTNGCTGTANFEVKEFIFKLSGLTDLDFGKHKKGTSISKILTLKNESNAEINISRIFTKSNSPEFQIKTVPALPAKIKQNETIEIEITFTPLEFKEFQDSLIVETNAPCQNEISSRLFGKTGAKTLVFLPDTTGAVGTKDYCLPLFAVLSENTNETLSYSARIKFSAGLFEPDNIYSSYIRGSERFVDLKGDNVKITNLHTKLGEFCGTILLADQDRTPLIIDNFEWSNTGIENEKRDGSLTILGICARNISRLKLFQSDEISLSPNPAEDFIEISVGSGHASTKTDIRIFNVFGEIVKNPTPTLPKGEGLRIDVSRLPTGIYFLRVGDKVGKFVKI